MLKTSIELRSHCEQVLLGVRNEVPIITIPCVRGSCVLQFIPFEKKVKTIVLHLLSYLMKTAPLPDKNNNGNNNWSSDRGLFVFESQVSFYSILMICTQWIHMNIYKPTVLHTKLNFLTWYSANTINRLGMVWEICLHNAAFFIEHSLITRTKYNSAETKPHDTKLYSTISRKGTFGEFGNSGIYSIKLDENWYKILHATSLYCARFGGIQDLFRRIFRESAASLIHFTIMCEHIKIQTLYVSMCNRAISNILIIWMARGLNELAKCEVKLSEIHTQTHTQTQTVAGAVIQ